MPRKEVAAEHQLYQSYDTPEEIERIKVHYEKDPRFFDLLTGGTWHVYSHSLWTRDDMTSTQAEEAKLDLLGEAMQLKPGKRILDVGAGWGGPLVYLCKQYGVTGVGIMLNEDQRASAQARAKQYGVDATFYVSHWKDYGQSNEFDAVFSDEVMAHFPDLGAYFQHTWNIMKMGGRFVNKELHYTHKRYSYFGRTGEHVHALYGYAGYYVTLGEELVAFNNSGFELIQEINLPMTHYQRTMDQWLKNMYSNQEELKTLSNEQTYQDFRKYLKIMRRVFSTNAMSSNVVIGEKIDPDDHA